MNLNLVLNEFYQSSLSHFASSSLQANSSLRDSYPLHSWVSTLSLWLKIKPISPHPVHSPPFHVWVPDRIPFFLFFSLIYSLGLYLLSLMINLIFPAWTVLYSLSFPRAVWLPPLLTTCKAICLTQPQILEKENPGCFPWVWLQTPWLVGFKKEWDFSAI